MEVYEIRWERPDGDLSHSYMVVQDQSDAIAMAKGLTRVTTIKRVAVYSMDDLHCVYYDELKVSNE